MVSKALELLQAAGKKGVQIYLEQGQLQVKFSKGKGIDPKLLEEIRENKGLLTEFLLENEVRSSKLLSYETELLHINRADYPNLPLSYSQERLWFIDQLEGSTQYHIPSVIQINGNINIAALESAFQTVINRHEVLRTVYEEEDGQAIQRILDKEWHLKQTHLNSIESGTESLLTYTNKIINQPFDLRHDNMLRCELIGINPTEHVLVVTLHHIASDGWSIGILVKEVVDAYNAFSEGRKALLPPLPVQYADFALWQRNFLTPQVLGDKLAYWQQKLSGVHPLDLPTDFTRPTIHGINGSVVKLSIDKEITTGLQQLSKHTGGTLFMTLLAAFKLLLCRYSGQSDICVGTPTAGRQIQELEGLIGFFINTLALRTGVDEEESFGQLLQKVKTTTLEAYQNQEVPFERVVEQIVKERDLSRSPVFQAMFVLQNTPEVEGLSLAGATLHGIESEHSTAKFELTFTLRETPNGLKGMVEYSTDLFAKETIDQLVAHYTQLLSNIVQTPYERIADIGMLTAAEEGVLVNALNNTNASYPTQATIVSLLTEQAIRTPANTAVVFENETLTYIQLHERSNQLAHYLRQKGVKAETLVPVCLERGIPMIVGILGILKAGGAYVPIDPSYPAERIKFIIEDTGATMAITTSDVAREVLGPISCPLISIEDVGKPGNWLQTYSTENVVSDVAPDNVAYVIYTSGSTGTPKGVMIAHYNIVRLFFNDTPLFYFTEKDVWTLFHSFAFDFSVWEIFGALLFGGKLVVVPKEATRDVALFSALLQQEGVTILNQTPGAFYVLQEHQANNPKPLALRYIIFGGEALNIGKLTNWMERYPGCALVNMYGITETTVHVTFYRITKQDLQTNRSVIGRPIPTLGIVLLNPHGKLVPTGVAGEMYVSGAGVARGYLNNEPLTAQRFVSNNFKEHAGKKLYRSGDLARLLRNGTLEYMGRKDEQVKIRGYRIELGEIESQLQQSGLVKQAVVIARTDVQGNKQLVAYVVAKNIFDKEELTACLQDKLPAYMVPALWVPLNEMPLTANGKVDKNRLPAVDLLAQGKAGYVAPQTTTEKDLATIWQHLLGVERIGIDDNFFELGGDSITTIQVVSRAARLGYNLKPKDIFIHQTVRGLSRVSDERSSYVSDAEQGALLGLAGLLPIQQWYLKAENEAISFYNQSLLLGINKKVDASIMQQVLNVLVNQHDALRFTYANKEGQWQQQYATKQHTLETEELQQSSDLIKDIRGLANGYQQSLTIEKGELLKAVLIKTPSTETHNRLLMVVHHLAIDGVSWRILLEDLEVLLSAAEAGSSLLLPAKTHSYRQWHDALVQYGKSTGVSSGLAYWKDIQQKARPIPVDMVGEHIVRYKDVASHRVQLDASLTESLLQLVPRVYHTGINDVLLAALGNTFKKLYQINHLLVGLEGHGREDITADVDTSRTVGWFTSLYPVLIDSKAVPDNDTDALIKSVKEQMKQIPGKGLGYGVLKYLNNETALQGTDQWEVMFNYLGQFDNVLSASQWLTAVPEGAGATRSSNAIVKEKILVTGQVLNGSLHISLGYSSLHFLPNTIEQLANTYLREIASIIEHCKQVEARGQQVFTPSDFGLEKEISYVELDQFLQSPKNGIPQAEQIESMYRLSGLQQGMLFHSQYQTGGTAYIEQVSCVIKNVDANLFGQSWQSLLNRHTILRSAFLTYDFSIPVQVVYKNAELPLQVIDLSANTRQEQENTVAAYEKSERQKGFDFKEAPLLRIILLKLADGYQMIWTYHHILLDGWSVPILMQEFLQVYDQLQKGLPPTSSTIDRFEDFIRIIEKNSKEDEAVFWKEYVSGLEQPTLLPFISNKADRNTTEGEILTERIVLPETDRELLLQFAQQNRLTVNTIMQGVWAYLLSVYSGNQQVMFGTITSGRPGGLADVEQRVGMYINTLPLHATIENDASIGEWLAALQNNQVNSQRFQHTPIYTIQALTGITGDLFDTLLIFENYPVSQVLTETRWSLQFEKIKVVEQTNYPLSITVQSAHGVSIVFHYNSALISKKYAFDIKEHFNEVLHQIVNGVKTIGELNPLHEAQQKLLSGGINFFEADYPKDKTVIQLFEERVKARPSATALVFNGEKLTYAELNERSNGLAGYLQQQGVTGDTLVPICLERGIEMIVAILGIMKAGGAYVPIDPVYPAERILYMLHDTGATIVISDGHLLKALQQSDGKIPGEKNGSLIEVFSIADNQPVLQSFSAENLPVVAKGANLAYVIYTSGSTGKPKGVMVEHRNLANFTAHQVKAFKVTEEENILLFSNYAFDGSVEQLVLAFTTGATLVVADKHTVSNPDLLLALIEREEATHFVSTPGFLETVTPGKYGRLKRIVAGGEPCPVPLAAAWSPYIDFYNAYGPTETTVTIIESKFSEAFEEGLFPIGKPFANTRLYLVNGQGKLVPEGVQGEIWLGGDSVTRGYVNLPDLTNEKFIADPFSPAPGARIYKTGDIGRLLPDGNLEYLGRKDDQVKVRGYRIELGEIEHAIQQSGMVNQVVVLARPDKKGANRLVAYVVTDTPHIKQQLTGWLENRLPSYMVPSFWVTLEKMPLTTNGKVDKRSLPAVDTGTLMSAEYRPPQTPLEIILAAIWQELLGVDRVGLDDNFFELGGDSITTIQVVSRLRRHGYIAQPKDVFANQTVDRLCRAILKGLAGETAAENGYLEGEVGLLPIQQLYFQKKTKNVSHFNQTVLLAIDKRISDVHLANSINQLCLHHDALRFIYHQRNGQWVQQYGTQNINVKVVDLSQTSMAALPNAVTLAATMAQQELDLASGQTGKVLLLATPLSDAYNRVLLVLHHLVVDGVSWRILLEDLELLLSSILQHKSANLGQKTSSYRQWYHALVQHGRRHTVCNELPYWKNVTGRYVPLQTDTGYEGKISSADISTIQSQLNEADTERILQEVSKTYHTDVNDILLSALVKTITRFSGRQDVVIGLEGHGREDISNTIDISRTVGWFTNLYPVLLQNPLNQTDGVLIKSIKEQLRRVPHKGIGYGVLKFLNKEKSLEGSVCWDIVFNYLGQTANILQAGSLFKGTTESTGPSQSETLEVSEKLSVNAIIQGGRLVVRWSFSERHFHRDIITKLANEYLDNLSTLVQHCRQQLLVMGEVLTPSDFNLGGEVELDEWGRFMSEPFNGVPRSQTMESIYRLSGLQQGILFHSMYDDGLMTYMEQFMCTLSGIDLKIFNQTWQYMVNKHSVLRTAFHNDAFNIPVQCVYKNINVMVEVIDLSHFDEVQQRTEITDFSLADRRRGFNFINPPLMRITLIKLDSLQYKMVWTYSHILFDGWSMPILMHGFLQTYEDLADGRRIEVGAPDKFEDHIRLLEQTDKDNELHFWKEYTSDVEESTLLPFISPAVGRNKGHGEIEKILVEFDEEQTALLQQFAKLHHLTLNTLMQGVWAYLLHQYTGNSNVTFGVVVSGRPDELAGIEQRVGMFINSLPLNATIDGSEEIVKWLQQLQHNQVLARQYQHTPLTHIQSIAGLSGDWFDTLMVFENYPINKVINARKWKLRVSDIDINFQTNYPLSIAIGSSNTVQIKFFYNTSLLQKQFADAISTHFKNVLQQVAEGTTMLYQLQLVCTAEKELILNVFNNTFAPYPVNESIIDIFEARAKQYAQLASVENYEGQITYAALNERSDQLAKQLLHQGIMPQTLIPVFMDRGPNLVVGILGILKAGCAFVPIDTNYPAERILFILADTAATYVLSSRMQHVSLPKAEGIRILKIEDFDDNIGLEGGEVLLPTVSTGHIAYVIYTSGSTGTPKGVMVEHGGVVNLAFGQADVLRLKPGMKTLQFASIGFDASCYEIFNTLLSGGTLVIPQQQDLLSVSRFSALVNNYKVDLAVLPPSFQNEIKEHTGHLTTIVSAGEPLNPVVARYFQSKNIRLLNAYGPTENTVCATITDKPLVNNIINIGGPVPNVQVYICDKGGNLCPVGIAGELCLSGNQVARGYLNLTEATKKSFVANRFNITGTGRMYKTGDMGRWLPDGSIEFLGRRDDQVKIRGHRVELGEIQSALLEIEGVHEAAVLVKEVSAENKVLVAFVVAQDKFEKGELNSALLRMLPDFMVPGIYVLLPKMPVTNSGKINRKQLASMDIAGLDNGNYLAPDTPLQEELVNVWQKLLHRDHIGIGDNFFELGGHSLLAMRLASSVRRSFKVDLSIKDLFENPTIALLSKKMDTLNKDLQLPFIQVHTTTGRIPLSFSQERLWFIDQLEGSVQYHLPTVLRLKGNVNIEALTYAFKTVINRHEVLRTVIQNEDGEQWQTVLTKEWTLEQIAASKDFATSDGLKQAVHRLITKPFNLSGQHMVRASLMEVEKDNHILVVILHHLASDAWSVPIFVDEVTTLYNSYVLGTPVVLPALPLQYADYAIWQRQYLSGAVLDNKLFYWKNKLKGAQPLQLPLDHTRPVVWTSKGALTTFSIDAATANKLQELGSRQGTTLYMSLLAAFNILLYRYSGQRDICVGSIIANRTQQEVEGLIGFFVNTIALRTSIDPQLSFAELLQQVKANTLEAYEHQDVPFEKVIEAMEVQRDLSQNPLFQVLFVLQNTPAPNALMLEGLEVKPERFPHNSAKFDLSFYINETPAGLHGTVEYYTEIFEESTIKQMVAHYLQLLSSITDQPLQVVAKVSMLSTADEQQLLKDFNDTDTVYPAKTVIDLFYEKAFETPNATAVEYEGRQLSYSQLNQQSNHVAQYLLSKGVKTEMPVPICLERGFEMIIGIVAILKAGGAYVPVDPSYPAERIIYMLKDIGSRIILTTKEIGSLLPELPGVELINIDEVPANTARNETASPECRPSLNDLAYVIYTSGSTGKPKGAMNEHGALANRLLWALNHFDVKPADAILQKTSFSFDVSVWELLLPLIAGARLVLAKPGGQKDNDYLKEVIERSNITMLHFVPSMLGAFLPDVIGGKEVTSIKKIICSGEVLPPSVANSCVRKIPGADLYNLYGPTEAAIDVTWWKMPDTVKDDPLLETIPIGKPVANTRMYILNEHLQLAPLGAKGQLFIGGIQVGRGYFHNEILTAEKFVNDPFIGIEGAKMYNTGDIGRWMRNGNIEYLGRTDEQVKIRGFRIELGEIENVITNSELVKQAAVLVTTNKQGNQMLCAYVVDKQNAVTDEQLIQHLSQHLPAYMVPQAWVHLFNLPLSANGKIDRKALAQIQPDLHTPGTTYVAPQSPTEKAIATVWSEVLGVENIGLTENFFKIGGDSIITIQVVSRLRREGIVLLPRDIFLHQTIGKIANYLETAKTVDADFEQGILEGQSGLLPIQQWYLQNTQQQVAFYNQALFLKIDKKFDHSFLQECFTQLGKQHDALRFLYNDNEGEWQQYYSAIYPIVEVQQIAPSASSLEMEGLLQLAATNCQASLSLNNGPLVRVILFNTENNDTTNRLLIVAHHLVIDGVSWRILLEDLNFLLTQPDTGKRNDQFQKTASYRQWYKALKKYGEKPLVKAQLSFWTHSLQSFKPLHYDKGIGVPAQVKHTAYNTIQLDSVNTEWLLQKVGTVYVTEINDLLLATLASVISDRFGLETVLIGMEGHGREDIDEAIDTSRTVGWFTTLYPVAISLNNSSSIELLIKSTKEQLRQIPAKGMGYGVLKYINKELSLAGPEPWDVVFNYFGQLDQVLGNQGNLQPAREQVGPSRSSEQQLKEKLTVTAVVQAGRLSATFGYSTLHFFDETIKQLSANFKAKLIELINDSRQKAAEQIVINTPSDFGLEKDISYQELDHFLQQPRNGKTRRQSMQSMYRLSGLQQGMLFHSLFDREVIAYTDQFLCTLTNVNSTYLQQTWQYIIDKHSVFKTAFYNDAFNVPVQCVYKEVSIVIETIDFSKLIPFDQQKAIDDFALNDRKQGFDFSNPPLMRITLLKLNSSQHKMVWTYSHILFDGWSMPILMQEFLSSYEALSKRDQLAVNDIDSFEDHIRLIEKTKVEMEELFWREYVSHISSSTLLPFIPPLADRTKGYGTFDKLTLDFDGISTEALQQYTRKHSITINTLMQGVWAYLLHQYTGSEHIVYGSVVSGRPDELTGVEQRVGLFINTLPFHSAYTGSNNVIDWLQQLQHQQVLAREFQHTPLSHIQQLAGIKGDWFDTIMVFENYPVSKVITAQPWQLNVSEIGFNFQTNYPFSVLINSAETIQVNFIYDIDLVKVDFAKAIAGHFKFVLEQVVSGTDVLQELQMITPAEKNQILSLFNDTASPFPVNKSIVDVFDDWVTLTPYANALEFKNELITYTALQKRSTGLAHQILGRGVTAQSLIPVFMERGIDMIVSVLAIVKAGCAFVPIDISYPPERIKFIIDNTRSKLIVTTTASAVNFPTDVPVELLRVDTRLNEPMLNQLVTPFPVILPEHVAYIIYTSGSTGAPKGVMVQHGGVVNLAFSQAEALHLKPGTKTLQFASISFDASCYEIFNTLLSGGTLVIPEKDDLLSVKQFEILINRHKVDLAVLPPSFQNEIKDHSGTLSSIVSAGEPLNPVLASFFQQKGIIMYNAYGPTENTVCATITNNPLQHNTVIIGKPLSNVNIYIVNAFGNLCPVGVPGELLLAGNQVAKGYLHLEELTKKCFIEDQYRETFTGRMYKSGDLGRWLPDGSIEFLGRWDDQVKIRGHRIELGEIETNMLEYEHVVEAVVLVKEIAPQNKQLVAYVVARGALLKETLLGFMAQKLPEYMVPSTIVIIEKMPVTNSGKIDKRKLAAMNIYELFVIKYVAPATLLEESLVNIWQELLQKERIGVEDNFFDLGGNSLLAMRLVSYIERQLKVTIPIQVLFQARTVSDLSKYLEIQKKYNIEQDNSTNFELIDV